MNSHCPIRCMWHASCNRTNAASIRATLETGERSISTSKLQACYFCKIQSYPRKTLPKSLLSFLLTSSTSGLWRFIFNVFSLIQAIIKFKQHSKVFMLCYFEVRWYTALQLDIISILMVVYSKVMNVFLRFSRS